MSEHLPDLTPDPPLPKTTTATDALAYVRASLQANVTDAEMIFTVTEPVRGELVAERRRTERLADEARFWIGQIDALGEHPSEEAAADFLRWYLIEAGDAS